MSRRFFSITQFFIILLLFSGCKSEGRHQKNHAVADEAACIDFAHPVTIEYAKGFEVENHSDYKIVRIFHPDTGETIDTFVLYLRGHQKPKCEGEITNYIAVPLEKIITTSTVQVGAFTLLDAEETIIGATSLEFTNSEKIHERAEKGFVKEVGKGMSHNMELILSLQPDALFVDYTRTAEEAEKYKDAGIPLIIFNSWKDQSLLGRAEWMKLIALLVGKNQKAEELFQKICSDYHELKNLVAEEKDTISIMYGQDYKGVWYVPGEYSYVSEMFRDAKLSFDYIPNQVTSEPRNFELIFNSRRHAMFWLCTMAEEMDTVDEFVSKNEHYKHFDAAKKGTIASDRKRVNPYGGNDYWESGPYRPDLLLKDIIKVTRPHLLPDYETTYWKVLTRE